MADLPDDLRLSHWSDKPLGAIRSVVQGWEGDYRSKYHKPKGLWVSVDGKDDWQAWCESEMPQWMEGHERYRITLAAAPRILMLPTPFDLDTFTSKYGREFHWGPGGAWTNIYIDWPAVAADYSGVIIAPFHWSRRMHDRTGWYYCWDCASGCIWDADAIARVENYQEAVAA